MRLVLLAIVLMGCAAPTPYCEDTFIPPNIWAYLPTCGDADLVPACGAGAELVRDGDRVVIANGSSVVCTWRGEVDCGTAGHPHCLEPPE